MKKTFVILAAILAACMALTACASSVPTTPAPAGNGAVGTLLLSVNPEIEIEYDKNGLVVSLEGANEDGKKILAQYPDFDGKTCAQVMGELVDMIYEAGCFELEVDGNPKNIVVKLEIGSAYPDEGFLDEVAESVRTAVANQGGQSGTMVVDRKDLDPNGLIGLEKAKELVLSQLGLTEADFTDKDYELDDGVYELEFTVGDTEYEYEVDAFTGKILKADTERNDDWDDDDDGGRRPGKPALTLDEVKAMVFEKLGITEDMVIRKEYDLEEGIYELEFRVGNTKYEFEIDAETGKILKAEKEVDGKEEDLTPPPALTLDEVKAMVFEKLGITEDMVIRKEYDLEEGIYELEFRVGSTKYEFEIDAETGKILHMETEKD